MQKNESQTSKSRPLLGSRRWFKRQPAKEAVRPTPKVQPEAVPSVGDVNPAHAGQTLAILGLAAALLGYAVSPANQVNGYTVSGNQELSTEEILQSAGLRDHQRLQTTLAEAPYFSRLAQKNHPQIASLHLSLGDRNQVNVQVTEIPQVGFIQQTDKYYPLLEDGSVLKSRPKAHPVDGFPAYEGFVDNATLDRVVGQFGQLSLPLRRAVSEVIWAPTKDNKQRIVLYMNDGNQVLVSADDIARKLKYYPGMAAQLEKKGMIDLQVGAYAKPFGAN